MRMRLLAIVAAAAAAITAVPTAASAALPTYQATYAGGTANIQYLYQEDASVTMTGQVTSARRTGCHTLEFGMYWGFNPEISWNKLGSDCDSAGRFDVTQSLQSNSITALLRMCQTIRATKTCDKGFNLARPVTQHSIIRSGGVDVTLDAYDVLDGQGNVSNIKVTGLVNMSAGCVVIQESGNGPTDELMFRNIRKGNATFCQNGERFTHFAASQMFGGGAPWLRACYGRNAAVAESNAAANKNCVDGKPLRG